MKRFFLIALLSVSVIAAMSKDSKARRSGTTYAQEALQPYVESGQLAGAISVFYNNGVEEVCCAGYADVAAKRPIALDNIFMQCSQTKGFCGVTVAKLVEQGKLSLDDPVSKYLPEFATLWILVSSNDSVKVLRKANNVLTIRMVLNHTGGFPFEISAKQGNIRGGGWSGGAPLRQTAAIAASSPISFEPGTREQYSNTGIDIAAAIVEVVTGMKWEDYLAQEVLIPLGMTSSSFKPSDKLLENKIEMYRCQENGPAVWVEDYAMQQRPYNDSHVFPSAGAGLWTTAADQLKFYKMLMNYGVGENGVRILEEETVKRMLAHSTRPIHMGGYSLGLSAPKEGSDDHWFGHGGALGTNCMVNPKTKQLKLYVVQICGGPQPWRGDLDKAANKFFESTLDMSKIDAYTGRTE